MKDPSMTEAELIREISVLKQRIRELEKSDAERKTAKDELHDSEHRYSTLFTNAAEGLLVADLQTKQFIYANPALCRMFGHTEEEILLLGVEDIHPKESLEHVLTEFDAQARGEKTLTSNIPCLRKDGSLFYADINTTLIVLDGKECNLGFFTDVTDRKCVEEALRESEQKFKDLSEKSVAGIYLIQDGIFKYANLKLARILGYEIDEIINKTAVKDVIFPEDWPIVEESMLKRISGGLESLQYEFRVTTKDKEVKNAEVYSSRTTYQGKPAIIGTYLDITDRKQAEKEKRHSEKLSAALEMAGAICHELNQPLQVIRGRVDLMSLENNDARILNTLEIINDQIHRIGAITKKLMGLEKYSNRDYVGAIKITDIDQTPQD